MAKKSENKQAISDLLLHKVMFWLICLVAMNGVILVFSNLAALKIWRLSLFGLDIPVDAGILFFPLSYLVGDLLVFIFGRKTADRTAYLTSFSVLLAVGFLWLARLLPDFPTADNSAFLVVQESTGRIFCASVVAFLVGQLVNNAAFAVLRRKMPNERNVRKWMLLSSVVARMFDVGLFEILAFVGRLPVQDFFLQMMGAYVEGMLLECILSVAAKPLALKLEQELKFSGGKPLAEE